MSINLITTPWLLIRRLSGDRTWICPAEIASGFDDPILALAFPRPDWNAAVTEFLIGLLACTTAPEDTREWSALWARPPGPAELAERLAPLAFAFDLGGDGPRCFQDHDALAGSEEKPISALLIDAPGENALLKNTDLFVKRPGAIALCPAYAAAALITMQTYAPAGGQGNRTSMRGGGPLTTLPLPLRPRDGDVVTTLWDVVWASVPCRDDMAALPEPGDEEWGRIFPWLAPARTSKNDIPTTPEHGHALQCYFATPRRIRLSFAGPGRCSLGGGESETTIPSFRQKNYGPKYEGWAHPHSPYYPDKKLGKLPYHPQPGGATYRDWPTWLAAPEDRTSEPARAIRDWAERAQRLPRLPGEARQWQSGVLACGYDMENMKALGWLEARIPYFAAPPGSDAPRWASRFHAGARLLVAGAQEAASALRYRLRLAKFGVRDREGASYTLPKTSPGQNAFDDLYERFWRETEADFLTALGRLREEELDEQGAIRRDFCSALRAKALHVFDEIAGTDELADQDARRIVEARSGLAFAFGEAGAVRKALRIQSAKTQSAKTRRSA